MNAWVGSWWQSVFKKKKRKDETRKSSWNNQQPRAKTEFYENHMYSNMSRTNLRKSQRKKYNPTAEIVDSEWVARARIHTHTQHSIRVRFWHFIHRNHTSQQAGRQADRKLFEIYRFSSYAWLSIVRILLSTAPRTAANVKPTDALNGNPLVRCLIISEIYSSWAMAVWCGRSVPFYIKQFLLSIINSVIPSIFFFCVQSLGCCVYRHAHRIDWHPPIWRANERTDGRLGSVYTVCLLCCRRTECCCESKIADVVALATVRLARSIHLPHKMNTYSSI